MLPDTTDRDFPFRSGMIFPLSFESLVVRLDCRFELVAVELKIAHGNVEAVGVGIGKEDAAFHVLELGLAPFRARRYRDGFVPPERAKFATSGQDR